MRIAYLLFFIIGLTNLYSQNWEPIGDTNQQDVCRLYYDSVDQSVYIGGRYRYINDTIDARGIVRWDGENFHTLGVFPNSQCNMFNCDPVRSIIRYKGDIYCNLINAGPNEGEIHGLAKWNGIKWDSVGSGLQGFVIDQIVYQDELYALGRFEAGDDSYYANGITKWDGAIWHTVDFPFVLEDSTSITVATAAIYNGDLYVGGNFWNDDETARDVARFDGENWYPVGEPIRGGWDDVWDIIVFQDELYICGDFRASSGNAGNKIMKLVDGSWTDVGGGFDSSLNQATGMVVYEDKLYVIGIFDSVGGGIPAQNIAVWDGEKWCGIGAEMDYSKLGSIVEFEGDLIITGNFDTIDNVVVSELARWTGGDYVDTCGVLVSGFEPESSIQKIELFPNPATDRLYISHSEAFQNQNFKLCIYNVFGEQLYSQRDFNVDNEIDTSNLSSGTYFLTLKTDNQLLTRKFVVQH